MTLIYSTWSKTLTQCGTLGLTDEDGNKYLIFSFPLHLRFESSYINQTSREKIHSNFYRWKFTQLWLLPTSPSLGFEHIFNRIRCVLPYCGDNVIVKNSAFCDGENIGQHLPGSRSSREFRCFRCCVPRGQTRRKEIGWVNKTFTSPINLPGDTTKEVASFFLVWWAV